MRVDGEFIDFKIDYITAITELFGSEVIDKTGYANVVIDNKYGIPEHPCAVVISAYNADRLVGIKTYAYEVPVGGRDGSVDLDYPDGSAEYVKVLIFTDLSRMIPYLTSVPKY